MFKRVLHHDPLVGITEIFHGSEDGESFTIETVQDVEPLLDLNKADLNNVTNSDRFGDGKIVARIPMVIYDQWLREGIAHDETALKAKLNDPDNRFMRIWPGHL
jgi:hypothetical protein